MSISVTTIADVAEAVRSKIAAAPSGTFSQSFTLKRVYEPKFDLSKGELDKLTVTVLPLPQERTTATRSSVERDIKISVAVMQKLPEGVLPTDTAANATIDPVLQVAQQLIEFFRTAGGEYSGADYVKTEADASWDRDSLITKKVVASFGTYIFKLES